MGLCLVMTIVELIGVVGNCIALVILHWNLIHAYGYLWLDDRVILLWIQLHDMHVDLTNFDLVWSSWMCIKVFKVNSILNEMSSYNMFSWYVCIWSHS